MPNFDTAPSTDAELVIRRSDGTTERIELDTFTLERDHELQYSAVTGDAGWATSATYEGTFSYNADNIEVHDTTDDDTTDDDTTDDDTTDDDTTDDDTTDDDTTDDDTTDDNPEHTPGGSDAADDALTMWHHGTMTVEDYRDQYTIATDNYEFATETFKIDEDAIRDELEAEADAIRANGPNTADDPDDADADADDAVAVHQHGTARVKTTDGWYETKSIQEITDELTFTDTADGEGTIETTDPDDYPTEGMTEATMSKQEHDAQTPPSETCPDCGSTNTTGFSTGDRVCRECNHNYDPDATADTGDDHAHDPDYGDGGYGGDPDGDASEACPECGDPYKAKKTYSSTVSAALVRATAVNTPDVCGEGDTLYYHGAVPPSVADD